MAKKSAGILVYRIRNNVKEYFLAHPGGPFWRNKDEGAWTIPKGEIADYEEPFTAAVREFKEETGMTLEGEFKVLSPIKQKSGKLIYAWAVEADFDEQKIICNNFSLEWPPKSGKYIDCPEIDKAAWFKYNEAIQKINRAQVAFIDEVESFI